MASLTDMTNRKTLGELRTGEQFIFPEVPQSFYVSRGNGWYEDGRGYQGGPWHRPADTVVCTDHVDDACYAREAAFAERGEW